VRSDERRGESERATELIHVLFSRGVHGAVVRFDGTDAVVGGFGDAALLADGPGGAFVVGHDKYPVKLWKMQELVGVEREGGKAAVVAAQQETTRNNCSNADPFRSAACGSIGSSGACAIDETPEVERLDCKIYKWLLVLCAPLPKLSCCSSPVL